MTKFSFDDVLAALKEANVDPQQQQKATTYLKAVAQELEEDKQNTKLPTAKQEFGVILFDKDGKVQGQDFTAAIYQIKQGDNHDLVLGKISSAARAQNTAAKRKKHRFDSMGEALTVKRAFLKAEGVNVKTKEPVRVLISNNQLV